MKVRKANAPITLGTDDATVFCAIELSKSRWVVALATARSRKVSLYRLEGGDTQALFALIERRRREVGRACGRAVRVVTCYEAGYDGFWLHRLLSAAGIENHVIDPASVQVNRRARRAKTDRLDAEKLLRTVMAYARGEVEVCAMARPPSAEEEDARRLHRERERLVGERTRHVNRIKGLAAGQGIRGFEPRRRGALARLDELVTGDGRTLGPRLRGELERGLARLALVEAQIAEVEAARDAVLERPAPAGSPERKIQDLYALKSIGGQIATSMVREVFYRSFDNRRQLGGYSGLAPSPYNSGGTERDQGVSKAGNPRARTIMIELAWLWQRHQPDSALSKWFRARVGSQKGRIRRIAIVALARKLLIALWRYLEDGVVPDGAVLKA